MKVPNPVILNVIFVVNNFFQKIIWNATKQKFMKRKNLNAIYVQQIIQAREIYLII